jgi:hypothetical protein
MNRKTTRKESAKLAENCESWATNEEKWKGNEWLADIEIFQAEKTEEKKDARKMLKLSVCDSRFVSHFLSVSWEAEFTTNDSRYLIGQSVGACGEKVTNVVRPTLLHTVKYFNTGR